MLSFNTNTLWFSKQDEMLKLLKQGKNEYSLFLFLRQNKHFTRLSFESCGIQDHHLKIIMSVIKKCPHLRGLDLCNNFLTNSGISILVCELPKTKLTHLDVNATGITQEHLFFFSNALINERNLNLTQSALNDRGVLIITENMNQMKLIDLNTSNYSLNYSMDKLPERLYDSIVLKVTYDDTIPLEVVEGIRATIEYNNDHNHPKKLSQCYLSGEVLALLIYHFKRYIPEEVVQQIADYSTISQVQHRAFCLGWETQRKSMPEQSANMLPILESKSKIALSL